MSLIRIQVPEGLLILGPSAEFPEVLKKADDKVTRQRLLRTLTRNITAMQSLRRNWRALFHGTDPARLSDAELASGLTKAIQARKLAAVFLSARSPAVELASFSARGRYMYLTFGDTVWLIGKPGHMPPTLQRLAARQDVEKQLTEMLRRPDTRWQITSQADQILAEAIAHAPADRVVRTIGLMVGTNQLAVYAAHHPADKKQIAQAAPPPPDIAKMSVYDKVLASLKASIKYMPGEVGKAVLTMLAFEAAEFVGGLVALGLAQLVPGANAAIDGVVLAIMIGLLGWSAFSAMELLCEFVGLAVTADSPEDIEQAGRDFAALVAMIGLVKFASMKQKMIEARGAGKTATVAEAESSSSGGNRNSRAPDREARMAEPKPSETALPKRKPFHRQDLDPKWYDAESGELKWPEQYGKPGTYENTTLKPGTTLDRYGGPGGNFTSPPGTPFGERALPYDISKMPYKKYEVLREIPVEKSEIAPWFDEPGGGVQYKTEQTIQQLLDADPPFLKEIP